MNRNLMEFGNGKALAGKIERGNLKLCIYDRIFFGVIYDNTHLHKKGHNKAVRGIFFKTNNRLEHQ